jgi:hypothetical protein
MNLYDSRVSEMDTVLLRGVGAGCGSKSTSMTEGREIFVNNKRCARLHAQVGGLCRRRYKLHNRCAAIPVHERRSGKRRQYGPQSRDDHHKRQATDASVGGSAKIKIGATARVHPSRPMSTPYGGPQCLTWGVGGNHPQFHHGPSPVT